MSARESSILQILGLFDKSNVPTDSVRLQLLYPKRSRLPVVERVKDAMFVTRLMSALGQDT